MYWEILLMVILLLYLFSFSNPFKMSIILLSISVIISVFFLVKLSSLWITTIVILIFSSGMMILFSYSSSLISLESKMNKKNKLFFLMLPFATFFFLSPDLNFSSEYFMKEFSYGMTLILMLLTLVIFMFPMMDNCSFPESPVQSSF